MRGEGREGGGEVGRGEGRLTRVQYGVGLVQWSGV